MKATTFKLDPKSEPRLSEEAKRRYDQGIDADIDHSDIPDHGDVDWSALRPEKAKRKPSVTMRLDESVIEHFKAEDPKGYTARMASVLSAYVASRQAE